MSDETKPETTERGPGTASASPPQGAPRATAGTRPGKGAGGGAAAGISVDKLKLLQDVEIPVSVEIGRTRLPVREILELKQGSVVTLDKEAEEPMDIRINGRLIGRGEIVVVKDSFGVRITEILCEEGGFA
jgi:flagellar motor switch protein FliN/FliY